MVSLPVAHQRPLPLVQQHQEALKRQEPGSMMYHHLVGGRRQHNVIIRKLSAQQDICVSQRVKYCHKVAQQRSSPCGGRRASAR